MLPDIHTIKRHSHHIEQLEDGVQVDDGFGSMMGKMGSSIGKMASSAGKGISKAATYAAPAMKSAGKVVAPIAMEMAPQAITYGIQKATGDPNAPTAQQFGMQMAGTAIQGGLN